MTRPIAALSVLLAASLLSGCHHPYQKYDGSYVTEYEQEDVTYWDDEGYAYETVSAADDAYETEEGYWYDGGSVVTVPAEDDSYDAGPMYDSSFSIYSSYQPTVSIPWTPYRSGPAYVPAPRYSSGYRPYFVPPTAAPFYRPAAPAWRYSPMPPASATIRTPPPTLIWPVRICPY